MPPQAEDEGSNAILLAFDEEFLGPGLVATSTALGHTDEDVMVFVGTGGLSGPSIDRVKSLPGSERLRIVELDELLVGIPSLGPYSPVSWATVFIEAIIPENYSRVVFLDADTMTRRPLDDLFQVNLYGRTLGACLDNRPTHAAHGKEYWNAAGSPPSAGYFNSGMMVIDMVRWRQREVRESAIKILSDRVIPLKFADQDALNALFHDDWFPLSRAWNYRYSQSSQIGADHAAVVHFVNPRRPWLAPVPIPTFQKEYLEQAERVGWTIRSSPVASFRILLRGVVPTRLTERRQRRFSLPRESEPRK